MDSLSVFASCRWESFPVTQYYTFCSVARDSIFTLYWPNIDPLVTQQYYPNCPRGRSQLISVCCLREGVIPSDLLLHCLQLTRDPLFTHYCPVSDPLVTQQYCLRGDQRLLFESFLVTHCTVCSLGRADKEIWKTRLPFVWSCTRLVLMITSRWSWPEELYLWNSVGNIQGDPSQCISSTISEAPQKTNVREEELGEWV